MRSVLGLALFFAFSAAAAIPDYKAGFRETADARSGKKIFADDKAAKAILFVGYLSGCPLLAKYQVTLKELKSQFGDKLLIVNFDPAQGARQNLRDTVDSLKKLDNSFPLVLDPDGKLNAKLGIATASEVALVTAADFELVYRGAIDDRLTLDFERPKALRHYARDAIQSTLSGKTGRLAFTSAHGCTLNLKSAEL